MAKEGVSDFLNKSTLYDLGVVVDENGKEDKRVVARYIVNKVKVMIQGKPNKNEKDVIGTHLDEFYELFVQQALYLAVAKVEINNLTLRKWLSRNLNVCKVLHEHLHQGKGLQKRREISVLKGLKRRQVLQVPPLTTSSSSIQRTRKKTLSLWKNG